MVWPGEGGLGWIVVEWGVGPNEEQPHTFPILVQIYIQYNLICTLCV